MDVIGQAGQSRLRLAKPSLDICLSFDASVHHGKGYGGFQKRTLFVCGSKKLLFSVSRCLRTSGDNGEEKRKAQEMHEW